MYKINFSSWNKKNLSIVTSLGLQIKWLEQEIQVRRNTVYNICHENTALRLLFCVPNLISFMTMKLVSLSIFPWAQSNPSFKIRRRLNFNDSLWQAIFEIFQIWTKYARLEWVLPQFPYLRHLQAIARSFETITKLSSNDIRETFCWGLKWMCNIFEINPQQDF